MIPAGDPIPATTADAMLAPDSSPRPSLLVDYERGGIAIGNASGGLDVKDWRARVDGDTIKIAPEPYTTETTLLTLEGVTEVSLAFDQSMRPVLAYVQAGVVELYWFNPATSAYVTTQLAGLRSPFLTLDDKRAGASATSDVILFYINGSNLCYRVQRESYATEHVWAALSTPAAYIRRVGFTSTNRLRVDIVGAALAGA